MRRADAAIRAAYVVHSPMGFGLLWAIATRTACRAPWLSVGDIGWATGTLDRRVAALPWAFTSPNAGIASGTGDDMRLPTTSNGISKPVP